MKCFGVDINSTLKEMKLLQQEIKKAN